MGLVGCTCMLVGVGAAGAREVSRGVTTTQSSCPDPNPTIITADNGNGTRTVIFVQSLAVNDNATARASLSWGNQTHGFSDLTVSDNAEFQLFNGNLQTVLDFFLDYLSASPGTPSGMRRWVRRAGRLDRDRERGKHPVLGYVAGANLNGKGYFAGGSQTAGRCRRTRTGRTCW